MLDEWPPLLDPHAFGVRVVNIVFRRCADHSLICFVEFISHSWELIFSFWGILPVYGNVEVGYSDCQNKSSVGIGRL